QSSASSLSSGEYLPGSLQGKISSDGCLKKEQMVVSAIASTPQLLPSSESPQLLPVTLDAAAEQPESLAEDPKTLSISCEVTFRHGTLRFNGNVSEKLLTLLIQELKR
ncbi:hypothetical protein ACUTT9_19175, partial [Shigella sonnei]